MTGFTPAAIDAALSLADAAEDVIATVDQGDLAAAIGNLKTALKHLDELRHLGAYSKTATVAYGWRFETALYIVDPGACNPSGIAHALIEACRQARDEGQATTRDPAVRLIVTQLAWICGANSDTEDYDRLMAECRRRADPGPITTDADSGIAVDPTQPTSLEGDRS